jgi:hypothetical protein
MSRRVTIYVPDDVAERLERESNASAYLAEAARRLMAVEATRDALAAGGYPDVPQDAVAEQARAFAQERRRRNDPELVVRMRQRLSGYQRT